MKKCAFSFILGILLITSLWAQKQQQVEVIQERINVTMTIEFIPS